jgi:magnesium chelatase subunit I
MHPPKTLGELRRSPWAEAPLRGRSVKDEMRQGLLAKLRSGEKLFPGIVGYDETVLPAIANAILSRHNFVLLGLRGQAKSRILRSLTGLLDPAVPAVAGCEIHDDPFRPICASCRRRIAAEGDALPIAWLAPEVRFVEKLATPDVTVADLIGDLDPVRAARGGLDLADERTIHYGLLPRANRGIFAVNELPDLAGKVQVSLFNIMQEGDVQIKGYPVRLPLDVALVFTANPEDYTARGKIITPLKDRIGSEVRTHYPVTLEVGMRVTAQESWTERGEVRVAPPGYLLEVIEGIAFAAREDSRVDRRSGVSQRLPITCLENVVSNAERRALLLGERAALPRMADVYAALPAVTGKIELEYEGELKGAEVVARELVRTAVARAFDRRYSEGEAQEVIDWFDQGGMLRLSDEAPARARVADLERVPGLLGLARRLAEEGGAEETAAAAEFVLEGLYAKKRISRSEERLYMKAEPLLRRAPARERGRSGGGFGFDDDLMQ